MSIHISHVDKYIDLPNKLELDNHRSHDQNKKTEIKEFGVIFSWSYCTPSRSIVIFSQPQAYPQKGINANLVLAYSTFRSRDLQLLNFAWTDLPSRVFFTISSDVQTILGGGRCEISHITHLAIIFRCRPWASPLFNQHLIISQFETSSNMYGIQLYYQRIPEYVT